MNHLKLAFAFASIVICMEWTAAMSIQEALSKNLVEVNIQTNETGTHYSAPFIMEVNNLSNKALDLELENGYLLEPADVEEQTMIVTNRILASLGPKEKKEMFVNAMCIEQHDAAPDQNSRYTFADLASPELRKLSAFIEKNKRFEPDAQFLMWDLADGIYDKEEISDFYIDEGGSVWVLDQDEERLDPIFEPYQEDVPQRQMIVYGSFEMNFSREKNVHIAMFNQNNVIVKELFKNPQTPVGKTQLDYEFNSLEYEEEVYFVKLVVDGEIIMTRTIEMSY